MAWAAFISGMALTSSKHKDVINAVALSPQAALEQAFADCLGALMDLARDTGHAEPAVRMGAAVQMLAPVEHMPHGRCGRSPVETVQVGGRSGLEHAPLAPLTAREREVAGLVAEGLTNRDIAERLVLSERTVDTHVQKIFGKLRLRSRTHVGLALGALASRATAAATVDVTKHTSGRAPSR